MYWKRCLGYLLLTIAVALGPPQLFFDDEVMKEKESMVVMLRAVALTPEALAPLCPGKTPSPSADTLAAYPSIASAISQIAEQGPGAKPVSIKSDEPARMLAKLGKADARSACFKSDGMVFRLSRGSLGSNRGGGLELVGLDSTPAGSAPALTPEQLAAIPALAKRIGELKGLAARAWARTQAEKPEPRPARSDNPGDRARREFLDAQRRMDAQRSRGSAYIDHLRYTSFNRQVQLKIDPAIWQALAEKLGQKQGQVRFTSTGYLFIGRTEMVWDRVKTPVAWLYWLRWVLAGLAFLAALWVMRGAYRAGPGIRINPVWSAIFGDVMFVLLLSVGTFGALDYLLQQLLDVIPKMDEALQAVPALMYIPALLILAGFATGMAGQSLEVNAQGLTRYASGGPQNLAWDEIQAFELEEMHIPVVRSSFVFARRLQTMLTIKGRDKEFSIMEPGMRATKRKLIQALADHAPDRLQTQVDVLRREW